MKMNAMVSITVANGSIQDRWTTCPEPKVNAGIEGNGVAIRRVVSRSASLAPYEVLP